MLVQWVGVCRLFATFVAMADELKTSSLMERIKRFLQSLSFRTGVIVLLMCIPCYILSFAQMALPISTAAKGVLWFILFGLAKTTQYGGLTILGVEGVKRLKDWWENRKNKRQE